MDFLLAVNSLQAVMKQPAETGGRGWVLCSSHESPHPSAVSGRKNVSLSFFVVDFAFLNFVFFDLVVFLL